MNKNTIMVSLVVWVLGVLAIVGYTHSKADKQNDAMGVVRVVDKVPSEALRETVLLLEKQQSVAGLLQLGDQMRSEGFNVSKPEVNVLLNNHVVRTALQTMKSDRASEAEKQTARQRFKAELMAMKFEFYPWYVSMRQDLKMV